MPEVVLIFLFFCILVSWCAVISLCLPAKVKRQEATWKQEVEESISSLNLNGHKELIMELLNESISPVIFMDRLEAALDETEYELLGRDIPYGAAFCASRRFGGARRRPYKKIDSKSLDLLVCTYGNVYYKLMGVDV